MHMIQSNDSLVCLVGLIPLTTFDAEFGELYCSDNGGSSKPILPKVGLLKHSRGLLIEGIVKLWYENAYILYFRVQEQFQTQMPMYVGSLACFLQHSVKSRYELNLKEDGYQMSEDGCVEGGGPITSDSSHYSVGSELDWNRRLEKFGNLRSSLEFINNEFTTQRSAILPKMLGFQEYDKNRHWSSIAGQIGIECIWKECMYFNTWLSKIEKLKPLTSSKLYL